MTRKLAVCLLAAFLAAGCTRPKPPIVIPPPVCVPPDPACTPPPQHVHTGETGFITIHDRQFWDRDGNPWTWVGMTDFLIWSRYLHGEDVDALFHERVALGAKVLRVFGTLDAFSRTQAHIPAASIYPQDHPDYYDKLLPFVRLANMHGLAIEFVLFADAEAVMPDQGMQDEYAEQVFQALETASADGFTNFLEGCNECVFRSNLPGGEARAYEVTSRFQGRSPYVLTASGSSATDLPECSPSVPYVLDYVTEHLDRGADWVRKHIDLREHRDGFTWGENTPCAGTPFTGTRVPTISDEPRGFDESVWGSRTTDVVAAGQAGGMAAMFGNGITFHSQSGLLSEPLGPIQTDAAVRMLQAARFINPRVQLLNYARGSDQGPCAWAYGPGPVEHTEGPGMRSFTKWIGNQFWVVQAGSYREAVAPCPGFALEIERVQGVAQLRQE